MSGMAPAACAPSMIETAPASRASVPIRPTGRTAPVVHRTWLKTTAFAGRSRAPRNASSVSVVVAAVAHVEQLDLDAEPIAQRLQRPEDARVLVVRGQHPVPGPPRRARTARG